MRSNWWLSTLAYAEMATLALVLYSLIRERMARKWPFLFATLLLEVIVDGTLMPFIHLHVKYRYYFWGYWGTAIVLSLLRFGVIADILRSFPGLDFLPKKLYLIVGMTGAAIAVISAYASFHDARTPMQVKDWALLLNRSVEVSWITFSVVVLASIKLFNFGWEPRSARIATGFFLRICSSLLVGELFISGIKTIRLSANALDSLLTVAIAIFWIYWIRIPPTMEDDPSTIEDSRDVSRTITALLDFCSSRES